MKNDPDFNNISIYKTKRDPHMSFERWKSLKLIKKFNYSKIVDIYSMINFCNF